MGGHDQPSTRELAQVLKLGSRTVLRDFLLDPLPRFINAVGFDGEGKRLPVLRVQARGFDFNLRRNGLLGRREASRGPGRCQLRHHPHRIWLRGTGGSYLLAASGMPSEGATATALSMVAATAVTVPLLAHLLVRQRRLRRLIWRTAWARPEGRSEPIEHDLSAWAVAMGCEPPSAADFDYRAFALGVFGTKALEQPKRGKPLVVRELPKRTRP